MLFSSAMVEISGATPIIRLDDIRSHLTSSFRRGVLVPFIGSGMSVPTCRGWLPFLIALATEAGIAVDLTVLDENGAPKRTVESAILYRLADRVVSALRPLPRPRRRAAYRRALRSEEPIVKPDQTAALAEIYWPLVMTTNYDDVYWQFHRQIVLGRDRGDCHRILRSLDEPHPPILWALQGFFKCVVAEETSSDDSWSLPLIDQLVVGHQQYQRATYSDAHFRRAFSEVYRRRSLLFLGSGIAEEYLTNLFSEIIHFHGHGAFTHFALIEASSWKQIDAQFLQSRLGIVPVYYENHNTIPKFLNQLRDDFVALPKHHKDRAKETYPKGMHMHSLGFTIPVASREATVTFHHRGLPKNPVTGHCSVVSVGRDAGNNPLLGRPAKAFQGKWEAVGPPPSFTYRIADKPVFAVAARRPESVAEDPDKKDLNLIPDAVCRTLKYIDSRPEPIHTVDMGVIAAGESRPWPEIHPFAQTIRGIRRFFTSQLPQKIYDVNVYIVGPGIWAGIESGLVRVGELLNSDLVTIRLDFFDTDGIAEPFFMTFSEVPTLGQALNAAGVDRSMWIVRTSPEPTSSIDKEPTWDMVLAPTMTVTLRPRNASVSEVIP